MTLKVTYPVPELSDHYHTFSEGSCHDCDRHTKAVLATNLVNSLSVALLGKGMNDVTAALDEIVENWPK